MGTGARHRLRTVGGALVAIGAGVLAGSLVTDAVTDASHGRAQHELRERWAADHASAVQEGTVEDPVVRFPHDVTRVDRGPDTGGARAGPPVGDVASREPATGDPFGLLWFERDGERVVTADDLVVLSGVTDRVLALAPGRYPRSTPPGTPGNLAIAGHRTTHGAPFDGIDELRAGDTIHVRDADGVEWAYRFRESRIVDPTDVWVVGSDPLGTGEATLTLTTCHPRHSARQRLVVFTVLDGPVDQTPRDAPVPSMPDAVR